MRHRHETTQGRIKRYNQPLVLIDYLLPYVKGKQAVRIADIGAGYISTIGTYLPGVSLEIYHSDRQDFVDFWKQREITPIHKVEIQDMERLTYKDEFFDVVHCANALDHTKNARPAVEEMIRVCKTGGWIYIMCNLDQKSTGGKHYWNAKQDGVFDNNYEKFSLKDYGFHITFIDNQGESRYNQIIATKQK